MAGHNARETARQVAIERHPVRLGTHQVRYVFEVSRCLSQLGRLAPRLGACLIASGPAARFRVG